MAPSVSTESAYRIEREGDRVLLVGDLSFQDASAIWEDLRAASKDGTSAFDLSQAKTVDGTVMALLADLRAELTHRGARPEITGASEQVAPLVDLYVGKDDAPKAKRRRAPGMLDQIGSATLALVDGGKGVLGFVGSMVLAVGGIVRRPRSGHLREVPPLVERAGADAVPIVLLINFLVGFVMAYQSARQLRTYGANIFVADLVGLAMLRELSPLLTAIIVAGRSGSAYAAQIGTMKVTEEIDALRTVGVVPIELLVLPKIAALAIALPLLTVYADVLGVLGGMVMAKAELAVGYEDFLDRLQYALRLSDFLVGIGKAPVFAAIIALVGCFQGLQVVGDAESVGHRTTVSVVQSIFLVIVADAAFSVAFNALGI